MTRREAAARRSRQRRAGVPLIEYAVNQWGDQRRYRRRHHSFEHAVTGDTIQWRPVPPR